MQAWKQHAKQERKVLGQGAAERLVAPPGATSSRGKQSPLTHVGGIRQGAQGVVDCSAYVVLFYVLFVQQRGPHDTKITLPQPIRADGLYF